MPSGEHLLLRARFKNKTVITTTSPTASADLTRDPRLRRHRRHGGQDPRPARNQGTVESACTGDSEDDSSARPRRPRSDREVLPWTAGLQASAGLTLLSGVYLVFVCACAGLG